MSFTTAFIVVLYAGCIIYAVLLLKFIGGLHQLKNQKKKFINQLPSVSIIVPARNEASNLRRTIQSLLLQEYSGDWEIIVVDDRSNDNTSELLKKISSENDRLHTITISTQTASPKKYALQRGIENSKGEIIVTTDADCIHHKKWLHEMISGFDAKTGVVAGLTLFDLPDKKIPAWQKIQWLDFFALNIMAAGASGKKIPVSCNASNLAYRRKVFDEVSGFKNQSHIVSGDDVLFIQRIAASTHWNISFAIAPETIVHSLPVKNFRALIHQRLRWASKGMQYCRSMFVFLFGVYFFFSMFIAIPFLMVLQPWTILYLSIAILWKMTWEFAFIKTGTKIFQQQQLLLFFIPWFFSIIFAAPLIGVGGLLLPYQWKETWYFPKFYGSFMKVFLLPKRLFLKSFQMITTNKEM